MIYTRTPLYVSMCSKTFFLTTCGIKFGYLCLYAGRVTYLPTNFAFSFNFDALVFLLNIFYAGLIEDLKIGCFCPVV